MYKSGKNRLQLWNNEKPSEVLSEEEILDAVYSFCRLSNFFEFYSDEEVYELPPKILQAMGEFFQKTTRDCSVFVWNTHRIRKDSILVDVSFGIADIPQRDYKSFETYFDEIIREAEKLIKEMDKKIKNLKDHLSE